MATESPAPPATSPAPSPTKIIVIKPSPSPATSAPASSPAAASTSSTGRWIWFVLAVLVVGGIVLLLALRGHRGRKKDWRSRAMAAYATASSLHDAISAEFPAVAPGADARWAELASLADAVTAELHGLEAGAPGQAARNAVMSAITALSALRSAIQTSRAAPSVQTLDTVRTTLSTFEMSLGALKNATGVRG